MVRLLAVFGAPFVIAGLASCGSSGGDNGNEPIGAGSGTDGSTSGDDASSGGGTDATIGADDGSSGSSSGGGTDGSTTEGGAQSDSGTAASDPSVYQHHKNGTRDGLYIDPVFTQTAARDHPRAHRLHGDGHHGRVRAAALRRGRPRRAPRRSSSPPRTTTSRPTTRRRAR